MSTAPPRREHTMLDERNVARRASRRYIGIDDAFFLTDLGGMSRSSDERAAAEKYAELFPAVYLRFHRRDGKRRELSSASRGVMFHLAGAGPLTVSECAKHLDRAQSVVSEIVDQLERHGLLARMRDENDRRRTLVWLTDAGRERLIDEQRVLSLDTLTRAFAAMTPIQRAHLLEGTHALLSAVTTPTKKETR